MSSATRSSPVSFRYVDGDWRCDDCGNINFARRVTCNRCNKQRDQVSKKRKLGHEIGKSAAEKSKGLFSADDWECNKCGNVNWARRQQCNVCNAPKFVDVEERTGIGGGYNDREIVEYKQRNESDDDEYDEFGRKKRCRQHNEDEYKEKPISHDRSYELDEEDDDDDDDLSKYDLTDFVDKSHSPIQ